MVQIGERKEGDFCIICYAVKMSFCFLFSGHPVLHPPLAVEELGGRQDPGADDGPGPGDPVRGGEAPEEEAPRRLPLLQPQEPQLLDVQILLLRAARFAQCRR